MTRSLFFKLFVRLALAAGAVLVVREVLPPVPVWVVALLLLLWAAAMALWTAYSLRRILKPLQESANALGQLTEGSAKTGQQAPLSTRYRDFDGLAIALAQAAEQVQRSLGKAAESRRELEALLDSMQGSGGGGGCGRADPVDEPADAAVDAGWSDGLGQGGACAGADGARPGCAGVRFAGADGAHGFGAAIDVADAGEDLRGECVADAGGRCGGGAARRDAD